ARRERYAAAFGLKPDVARVLVGDRLASTRFEDAIALGADPRAAATWITQDVAAHRNTGREDHLTSQHIADLVRLIADDTISGPGAKSVLEEAFDTGESIEAVVDRLGLRQVSDTGALKAYADEVISQNPDVVERFRAGNDKVIGF